MEHLAPLVLLPGMNLDDALFAHCQLPQNARVEVLSASTINTAVEALAEKTLEPSVLAGVSLGAIVAMAFARQHPHKVAGLVLCATNGAAPTKAQDSSWQDTITAIESGKNPRDIQQSLLPLLLSPTALGDPELVQLTLEATTGISTDTLISQLKMQRTRINELPHLRSLKVPVEVLCGSADQLCPVSNHRTIHSEISQSHLRTVPDAGHLLPLERPEEFEAALWRIYQRLY